MSFSGRQYDGACQTNYHAHNILCVQHASATNLQNYFNEVFKIHENLDPRKFSATRYWVTGNHLKMPLLIL